ncbi:MAG TPA: hypothetical protein VJT71_03715 [Pyrinomonadaceae bacterium]|nr:hypothetical protein [Pyrinomonadaceae bacterium]
MSSRLSVIFYVILCLEIGIVLTVLPWVPHGWLGLSDWGNNYFLWLASHKTGYGLQRVVSSGWVRGAVSGIGVLNLAMGIWELINIRQTVRAMEAEGAPAKSQPPPPVVNADEARAVQTDPLSDYPRRNR